MKLNNYISQKKQWPKWSLNFYKVAYLTEFGGYIKSKNLKILDLGCGGGEFLQILEGLGYENLYGVDIDTSVIKIAKKNLKKNNNL